MARKLLFLAVMFNLMLSVRAFRAGARLSFAYAEKIMFQSLCCFNNSIVLLCRCLLAKTCFSARTAMGVVAEGSALAKQQQQQQ
jgi:hypothetical protein